MIGSLVRLRPDYWQIKRSLILNSFARVKITNDFFYERTGHNLNGFEHHFDFVEVAENLPEFATQGTVTMVAWHRIFLAIANWVADLSNRPHLPYFSPGITFKEFWNGDVEHFNGFKRPFGLYEIDNLWMTREHDDVYGFEPDPEIIKNHPLSKNLLVTDFIEADRFRMLPVTPDNYLEKINCLRNQFTIADISEVTSKGMISLLQPELELMGPFHDWCNRNNRRIYFPIELFEVVSKA